MRGSFQSKALHWVMLLGKMFPRYLFILLGKMFPRYLLILLWKQEGKESSGGF